MPPPIFIISLKSSPRRPHISAALEAAGLAYAFVDTTDGRLVGEDIIDLVYDAERNARRSWRKLTRGEIFCAASHLWVCRHVLRSGLDEAVVLEDDAVITTRFADLLRNTRDIPAKVGILQFYAGFGHVRATPEFAAGGVACHRAVTPTGHAVGYLMRRKAAAALVAANPKIYWVPDWPIGRREVDFHVTLPWVIGHGEHTSTLETARSANAPSKRVRGLARVGSARELIGDILDQGHKKAGYAMRRMHPERYIDLESLPSDAWKASPIVAGKIPPIPANAGATLGTQPRAEGKSS